MTNPSVDIDTQRLREGLERLVRIPSIAFDGHPRAPLDEAAELVRELLPGSRFVEVPGEAPSVYAEYGEGGPTVLLYAHYDVQPAPSDGWDTDPFTPTVRDGRLYGRGAADDKSGIVAHLAALRANGKRPHVKVLIEGSEENGRQKLLEVVDRDPELMRADLFVVADGGNWKLGEPTLCETLRGHGKLTITLRTLENASASCSSLLTSRPVRPCSTMLASAPTGKATTGVPHARASIATSELVSEARLGMTTQRALAIKRRLPTPKTGPT